MNELLLAISKGATAFVVTNIDDIFILGVFFSQVNSVLRRRHVVVGQYLGFIFLILASLSGYFLGSFLLSPSVIRWLGLVPIALGLSALLSEQEETETSSAITEEIPPKNNSIWTRWLSPQTYGVAAVTVANGSDNIGVYVPLFAGSNGSSLLVILTVFLTLVGVWCYLAYKLISLPLISRLLTGYTYSFIPCLLISLGVFIIKESIPLTLVVLVGSCLWLLLFGKNKTIVSN